MEPTPQEWRGPLVYRLDLGKLSIGLQDFYKALHRLPRLFENMHTTDGEVSLTGPVVDQRADVLRLIWHLRVPDRAGLGQRASGPQRAVVWIRLWRAHDDSTSVSVVWSCHMPWPWASWVRNFLSDLLLPTVKQFCLGTKIDEHPRPVPCSRFVGLGEGPSSITPADKSLSLALGIFGGTADGFLAWLLDETMSLNRDGLDVPGKVITPPAQWPQAGHLVFDPPKESLEARGTVTLAWNAAYAARRPVASLPVALGVVLFYRVVPMGNRFKLHVGSALNDNVWGWAVEHYQTQLMIRIMEVWQQLPESLVEGVVSVQERGQTSGQERAQDAPRPINGEASGTIRDGLRLEDPSLGQRRRGRPQPFYSKEDRRKIAVGWVEQAARGGVRQEDYAKPWHITASTVRKYVKQYEAGELD